MRTRQEEAGDAAPRAAAAPTRRRSILSRSIAAGSLVGAAVGVIVAITYANRTNTGGTPLVLAILAVVLGASIGAFVGLLLEGRDLRRPEWLRLPEPRERAERPARRAASGSAGARPGLSRERGAPEPEPFDDDDGILVPPGWYPDPQGSGLSRYWDGAAWTEHTWRRRPGSSEPPAPAPVP